SAVFFHPPPLTGPVPYAISNVEITPCLQRVVDIPCNALPLIRMIQVRKVQLTLQKIFLRIPGDIHYRIVQVYHGVVGVVIAQVNYSGNIFGQHTEPLFRITQCYFCLLPVGYVTDAYADSLAVVRRSYDQRIFCTQPSLLTCYSDIVFHVYGFTAGPDLPMDILKRFSIFFPEDLLQSLAQYLVSGHEK